MKSAKKRLEQLKKKRAQLTEKLDVLQETKKEADDRLDRFWKLFGIPKLPASYGDYLHGLIVRAEFLKDFIPGANSIEDDQRIDAYLKKQMPGYNFANASLGDFARDWRKTSYARVSVGHKLTSVLMLTSVPDEIEVVAPWATWTLEIPDGMYPFNFSPSAFQRAHAEGLEVWDADKTNEGDELPGDVRALLCKGSTPHQLLLQIGGHYAVFKLSNFPELITNFVKGVCLSFDERKHVQERYWARTGAQRDAKEPGLGRHYTLSAPVSVDFRDEVKALLANPKAHVATAQWLVRGHWRNQACGVGRKDHKRIRIEPHWKGPADARVLLRSYRLKD